MEKINLSMWQDTDRGGIRLNTTPPSRNVSICFHRGVQALVDMYRPQSMFELLRGWIGDRFEASVVFRKQHRIVVVPLGLLPPRGWRARWKQKFGDFYSWFSELTKHPYGGRLYLLPLGRDFLLLGDKKPVPFLQIPDDLQPLITEARKYGVRFTYDRAPHIWAPPFHPYPEIKVIRITQASAVVEAWENGWRVEVRSTNPLPEVEGLKLSHGGAEGVFVAKGFFAGEYSTNGLLLALKRATEATLSAIRS